MNAPALPDATRDATGNGRSASPNNSALLQVLWVLFSDANSRFNTLVEECAHLQDTVIGLTSDPDLLDRIIGCCPAQDHVRGFKRVVCCEPKKSEHYYLATVRDRALLSIWTLLGGLIIALDRNQHTHEQAYRHAVEALLRREHARATPTGRDAGAAPDRAPSEHIFWYVQTRGYFLTEVCRHYTTQLEHAHEKLIQMLENQPGKLPTPILLRRWNSAMYSGFLSEYSRHVNWEAHRLLAHLTPDGPDSSHLTEDLSLTHTWTHQPTSMTQLFTVDLKTGGDRDKYEHLRTVPHRFATVRSAYFYLEQPILLPLLYHECAHIAFSHASFAVPPTTKGCGDFLTARTDAMRSLRLIKFPDAGVPIRYENFWHHFTEEIWSDAVALALGGRAYLVALALQLFGLSGEDSFDHFDLDNDRLHELGQLGGHALRKYPEPYPREDVAFFWEARIDIACDLLEAMHDCDRADRTWISAIRELRDAYGDSGGKAHGRAGTSARHEVLWDYRRQLNEWVRTTTMGYLKKPFKDLAQRTPLAATYALSRRGERACVDQLVNAYRDKYMLELRSSRFKLAGNARLESLPADIRWQVAGDISASLLASEKDIAAAVRKARLDDAGGQAEGVASGPQDAGPEQDEDLLPPPISKRLAAWTSRYANWMRNDGSAAFRIALEASRLRMSLYDALADELVSGTPGAFRWPFHRLDADQCRALKASGSVARLLRREVTNTVPADVSASDPLLVVCREVVDGVVEAAMRRLTVHFNRHGGEALVGTISLGVIRPDEIARHPSTPSAQSPFICSLQAVEGLWTRDQQGHERAARNREDAPHLKKNPDIQHAFARLLGDYQYLGYAKGTTPVERNFHASEASPDQEALPRLIRRLVKPRMVLQLAGTELSQALKEHCRTRWGRLSLIRLKYRWQWILLAHQLRRHRREMVDYALLTSSAWEDLILFTWFENQDDAWTKTREDIGVMPGETSGMDIQSMFIPPLSSCNDGCEQVQVDDKSGWEDKLFAWAERSRCVERIYSRSGRLDYTVIWKPEDDQGDSDVLGNCMRGLASIPKEIWQQVSSVISSYEVMRWHDPEVKKDEVADRLPRTTSGKVMDRDVVTHFAVKNRT